MCIDAKGKSGKQLGRTGLLYGTSMVQNFGKSLPTLKIWIVEQFKLHTWHQIKGLLPYFTIIMLYC